MFAERVALWDDLPYAEPDPELVAGLGRAGELIDRGYLDEAATALDALAASHPSSPGVVAGLARVALTRGDHERARRLAEETAALGHADGFAVRAELLRDDGDARGAAAAYLDAYLSHPPDFDWLAAHCALTETPYAEPNVDAPSLGMSALERLWLYLDLTKRCHAQHGEDGCPLAFHGAAAWLAERGIPAAPVLQALNDRRVWCDCDAPLALSGLDHGWHRLRIEGWLEAPAHVVGELRADGLLDREAPDDEAPRLTDGGLGRLAVGPTGAHTPIVPQLVLGFTLRSTCEAVVRRLAPGQRSRAEPERPWAAGPGRAAAGSASLGPSSERSEARSDRGVRGDRLVMLVGFVDAVEPPVILVGDAGGLRVIPFADRFERADLDAEGQLALERAAERLTEYAPPPLDRPLDLPDEAEERWLLDAVAGLVAAADAARWLAPPLVADDLPRRWTPDAEGIGGLTRFLMDRAGLEGLRLDVTVGGHDEAFCALDGRRAIGWFAGIEDGAARFGLDLEAMGEPEDVLATMAHEVAHAWRAHHGLDRDDREEDERLTDVTAHLLGFGVSVTNSAFRYRTGGELQGHTATSWWNVSGAGYLSAPEHSFLLALQAVVRGASRGEVRGLAARLEANQAGWLRRAHADLQPRADELRARLTASAPLPSRRRRGPRADLAMSDADVVTHHVEDAPSPGHLLVSSAGHPVFRVRQSAPGKHTGPTLLGLLAFAVVGGALGLPVVIPLGLVLFGGAAAMIFGRRRFDACSTPSCTAELPPEAETCPRCQGTISGRIAGFHEHLDAVEALEDAQLRAAGRVGEVD